MPVGARFPVAPDAPAEEVQALLDVGDQILLLRQAQAHRGEDFRDLVAQRLGLGLGAVHHQAPPADRLAGHDDAALEHQLLDLAERQREAEVPPHAVETISTGYRCPLYGGGTDDTNEPFPA
ncbi:hypothetical protein ACVW19_006251 [Streptomyces sp. TE5632]